MKASTSSAIGNLLRSAESCIRYKIKVNVLGENPESPAMRKLRNEIKVSQRVKILLSQRDRDGRIPYHPYRKWFGAHWVLATLAELEYPPGDGSLVPLREQVQEWLFSEEHAKAILLINGRVRRCASQEGNALYSLFKLGIADNKTEELAHRLMKWQWHDGGWNCDRNPGATNSSFMETLIPLRGLTLYGCLTGNKSALIAARKAAEVFLKRRMFDIKPRKRWRKEDFLTLHYPCYWHYDVLSGLTAMTEVGFISDKRCCDALDILERKQLSDGGFPAEKRYYQTTQKEKSGWSAVKWGNTGKNRMNEFVTVDALCVLKRAGRIMNNMLQV